MSGHFYYTCRRCIRSFYTKREQSGAIYCAKCARLIGKVKDAA